MSKNNQGLTLIEIMVVLGLMAVVGSFALMVSFDAYRDSSYHADRAALIAALQHARAESIDDVCEGEACTGGTPHGVSIEPSRYVIFQGLSYASRDADADEIIDADPTISHSGLSEVVFAISSGDVAQTGDILLTDASGHTSTTTIGSEGQISWTN